MDKVDYSLNIDDLKLMRNIAIIAEKRDKQREILKVLGKLYSFFDDYSEKEEIFVATYLLRKNCNIETVLNYVKSIGAGALSIVGIEHVFDMNVNGFYGAGSVILAGSVGFILFERELLNRDDYISSNQYLEAYKDFDEVFFNTWDVIVSYLNKKNDYLNSYHKCDDFIDWDKELHDMFLDNYDYLQEGISNNKFEEDFSYTNIKSVLSKFFNDDETSFRDLKIKEKKKKR